MEFLPKDIQSYSDQHTMESSDLLKRIDRETNVNIMKPRMLSGHMQGRILSMFSHMVRPSSILEIGTFTGYSALCLAEGLTAKGVLITIDINEELESLVKSYFSLSQYGNQIQYLIGNALDVIPLLTQTFDLVFIDADKINYLNYYLLVLPKMNAGGLIIVDNILWSGKVVEPIKKGDKDTPALMEFNRYVHGDDRVENLLLPVRDGLMMLRVK